MRSLTSRSKRALAAAGRPEQRDELALGDAQADIGERLHRRRVRSRKRRLTRSSTMQGGARAPGAVRRRSSREDRLRDL